MTLDIATLLAKIHFQTLHPTVKTIEIYKMQKISQVPLQVPLSLASKKKIYVFKPIVNLFLL